MRANGQLIKLMSRAGEGSSATPSSAGEDRSTFAKGDCHAEWDEKMEHWAALCRHCDRRGARCFWCLAGLG